MSMKVQCFYGHKQRRDDTIYIVYSMSNSPYQEWQARLLEFSLEEVRQPGTIVRCIAEDPRYPGRGLPDFGDCGVTIPTEDFGKYANGYVSMNRPGGLKRLFESLEFSPYSIMICVDPDMIFTKPWVPEPAPGTLLGQRWIGYSQGYCRSTSYNKFHSSCPETEEGALMHPLCARASDLQGMVETYLEATSFVPNEWMVEMTALVLAAKRNGLEILSDPSLGLCGDWPHADDESAPILHYCQPILDHGGEQIWDKRSYKAFVTPPDPLAASNRVGRGVLGSLHRYIAASS